MTAVGPDGTGQRAPAAERLPDPRLHQLRLNGREVAPVWTDSPLIEVVEEWSDSR